MLRALVLALAVAAAVAGVARPATFSVEDVSPAPPAVPALQFAGLPSSELPNLPGTTPPAFILSIPPAVPEMRAYEQLLALWQGAGAAYGVPWQVLAAITKIESNFGRNMGPSSAGAIGWMQFMPATWELWGMDASGDGAADPWNPEDAVYSAARYLAAAGAQTDLARAVFAYNHADWYVRDVLELASIFGDGSFDPALAGPGAQLVFQVDDLGQRLDEARLAVSQLRRQVLRAESRVTGARADKLEAEQSAGDPTLSARLFRSLEARAGRLAQGEERARARLAGLQARLDAAVGRLDDLEADASSVSFSPAVAQMLAGMPSLGGYVFPVGGGPSVVWVGLTHHDYPAADIAAPEGSPVYALASSVVLKAYPEPQGICGIGLELLTEQGESYAYCHLAYLEPGVVAGAALPPGALVGLVGQTGNATGPHLHLGLVPSDTYPQDEPWFQAFAGVAFSWQESLPAALPSRTLASFAPSATQDRVFTVVGAGGGAGVVTFTR